MTPDRDVPATADSTHTVTPDYTMNFYFQASNVLDRLDAKQGSIKGIIASVSEKDRKRTAALVIETLKCKPRDTTRLISTNQC